MLSVLRAEKRSSDLVLEKYMKEVVKHNFLESYQKTTGPEYSNSHTPLRKHSLQARPCSVLSSEQEEKC